MPRKNPPGTGANPASPKTHSEMGGRVLGLLLAGGQGRRMGGVDKGLCRVAGETLLARAIGRLTPQVEATILNANGDPARFAEFGLRVVPDAVAGFAGPLAGVLAGLEWAAANRPDIEWVASAPTDAPFLPVDLVARLLAAIEREGGELACAASGGRAHPVVGLWPVRLAGALRQAVVAADVRKVDRFTGAYRLALAEFPDRPIDPFFNVNTPEDLAQAERLAKT
jgi:molybdenum cofactor guanylyltransferase